MAITALRSGSVAWPPRRPSHQRTKARGEMMKADALLRFILSGNRSLEEVAVLLARISLGVFFAISGGNKLFMAPPVGSGAPSGCSWACWKRLTAGQMLPLCSYGEQMENRSADVADGVRRSVSRPGGVRPLPRREAVAGWFRLSCLRRLQGLGARDQAVHLGVFRLPPTDLGDRRYGHASEQVAAADVVRGDPPAGEPFERHFRRAGAGAIRHRQLQDGLAAAAQAAPGDGIAGAQLAAGHGGDGRDRSAVALEARPDQGLWHPECRQAADHWRGRTLPGRSPTAGAPGAVAGPHRRERPRLC